MSKKHPFVGSTQLDWSVTAGEDTSHPRFTVDYYIAWGLPFPETLRKVADGADRVAESLKGSRFYNVPTRPDFTWIAQGLLDYAEYLKTGKLPEYSDSYEPPQGRPLPDLE